MSEPVPRLVVQLPLRKLWRDGAFIPASRSSHLGEEQIKQFLRDDPGPFVMADVGHPLQWITGRDRFDAWKDELRPRLVPPQASCFHLDDFPNNRCYTASLWQTDQDQRFVLFETHH